MIKYYTWMMDEVTYEELMTIKGIIPNFRAIRSSTEEEYYYIGEGLNIFNDEEYFLLKMVWPNIICVDEITEEQAKKYKQRYPLDMKLKGTKTFV